MLLTLWGLRFTSRYYPTFLYFPFTCFIFFCICGFHKSFQSKWIPKYLTVSCWGICVLFSVTGGHVSLLVIKVTCLFVRLAFICHILVHYSSWNWCSCNVSDATPRYSSDRQMPEWLYLQRSLSLCLGLWRVCYKQWVENCSNTLPCAKPECMKLWDCTLLEMAVLQIWF